MQLFNNIASTILIGVLSAGSALAQGNASIAENAALRYWSAFSEVKDADITDQQAKEIRAILDGTAPYDDSKYKALLEKNTLALEIMGRGTSLRNCDWGLDYGLGPDMPVDYARKALGLGRLNVLYALHLFKTGNKEGAVHALGAGLRFSHDVGNGGTLLATLIAKSLLVSHLKAIASAFRLEQLSSAQHSELQSAVTRVGEGLDWPMAAKRDLEALRQYYAGSSQTVAALNRIISSYVAVLNDGSKLPILKQAIEGAPQDLADVIPNAKQVLEAKQDLDNTLQQTRSLLQ
ncbi:MAG: hypothetical protein JO182_10710 [Acidobacteriaceae bacterium]|nr:hypothetical protein [Acidobacteriaceae bacterium]MBV9225974.1 hypothetical protein [Acidobacteriaceae bacterium]MBV9307710.1 hypothetical protein [Acidobacteriaceae bacterium]